MKDYEETYSSFTWDRPDRYNFARDVIDKWAKESPDKRAMLWIDDKGNEVQKTFLDISLASKKLCNVLKREGVKRGDTIILMLGRNIEWWEVFTASLRMGAVISPGTTQLSSKDLSYRVNASNASCVITDSANAEKLDAVMAECPSIKSRIVIDDERPDWTCVFSDLG